MYCIKTLYLYKPKYRFALAKVYEHIFQCICNAGLRGERDRARQQSGPFTMFMRVVICATCTCHVVIFSEESVFDTILHLLLCRIR